MKTIFALLAVFALSLAPLKAGDSVDAELFPAEFLYAQRMAIGIGDEQLRAIATIMREAQPIFDEAKRQLGEAAGALQKILRTDRPDEDQADEKMRALLDCEGEIKMLQLRTLLAVRAQLTPEQLGKARKVRDEIMERTASEAGRHERVTQKLEKLRAAIKAHAPTGAVEADVVTAAKGIYQLLGEGKEAEAEKAIDELLARLADGKAKP